jgi:hypothetical protein
LRNRFRLAKSDPKAIDVLLSSEVGCEGLDYEFCDGMVNYDLPWNPMRVEQRIGRIDRHGQASDAVVIYNLITNDTVDAEIYQRCLLRIGVFQRALGGSEMILGRLTRQLRSIAEDLQLTADERSQRLQQLSDNEIRTVQEQARLEEEEASLFGLSLPEQGDDLVKRASSFWLRPEMLANLVSRYLATRLDNAEMRPLRSTGITTLQLAKEVRGLLLADCMDLHATGIVAREWECWLKGSDPFLPVTFDATVAAEQRDVVFVTPVHPLARQAAAALDLSGVRHCNMQVHTERAPPGTYPYVIYRWRKLGMKEDFLYQPVCLNPELAPDLLTLLEGAGASDQDGVPDDKQEQALEELHYRLWGNARARHMDDVATAIDAKCASLRTTHAARLAVLQEQLDAAADARIRRMRQSQIESATRDFERHIARLETAGKQADIIAEPVVSGFIVIGE